MKAKVKRQRREPDREGGREPNDRRMRAGSSLVLANVRLTSSLTVGLPPLLAVCFFTFVLIIPPAAARAQSAPTPAPSAADEVVVDGSYASDVFGLGRTVRVRGEVKNGALSFGGDVIVEGRVEGDVAAFGG